MWMCDESLSNRSNIRLFGIAWQVSVIEEVHYTYQGKGHKTFKAL
jgi:hypothetical protein